MKERHFYIINQPARSNMSAKIKIYEIDENGKLINLTGHYDKNNNWKNYTIVRGCGVERAYYYIKTKLVKKDEKFTYTYLNDFN